MALGPFITSTAPFGNLEGRGGRRGKGRPPPHFSAPNPLSEATIRLLSHTVAWNSAFSLLFPHLPDKFNPTCLPACPLRLGASPPLPSPPPPVQRADTRDQFILEAFIYFYWKAFCSGERARKQSRCTCSRSHSIIVGRGELIALSNQHHLPFIAKLNPKYSGARHGPPKAGI